MLSHLDAANSSVIGEFRGNNDNYSNNYILSLPGVLHLKLHLLKVARYPVFSRSTNLESKLIVFFVLLKFERTVRFGSLKPFTVCRQAVNFLKCAFILVQSKLSIPRVVTNMSLA